MTAAMLAAAASGINDVCLLDVRWSVCRWKKRTFGVRSRSSYECGKFGKIRERSCTKMKTSYNIEIVWSSTVNNRRVRSNISIGLLVMEDERVIDGFTYGVGSSFVTR
jgi:hypothetical protein